MKEIFAPNGSSRALWLMFAHLLQDLPILQFPELGSSSRGREIFCVTASVSHLFSRQESESWLILPSGSSYLLIYNVFWEFLVAWATEHASL